MIIRLCIVALSVLVALSLANNPDPKRDDETVEEWYERTGGYGPQYNNRREDPELLRKLINQPDPVPQTRLTMLPGESLAAFSRRTGIVIEPPMQPPPLLKMKKYEWKNEDHDDYINYLHELEMEQSKGQFIRQDRYGKRIAVEPDIGMPPLIMY